MIDLSRHKLDVDRIFYSKFAHLISRNGWDPEDVLSEIYLGILARNRGKCPWDASKSSLGHYVYMVCSCITRNYYRKMQEPKRAMIKSGIRVTRGSESRIVDVGQADLAGSEMWSDPEAVVGVLEMLSKPPVEPSASRNKRRAPFIGPRRKRGRKPLVEPSRLG